MIQEYMEGTEIGADVYVDGISGKAVSIFSKKKILMRAGETDKSVSFIDEKLFALLNRLGRAGHGAFNGKSSQNRILQILSKSGRMTQRELTSQLEIQPGSVSEIIKKLETAGLISRQSNSEDRRTVDIALTDAGKTQAEASCTQTAHQALFESLTDDEKQQLLSLLEKVGQDWHHRFRDEHRHRGDRARDHKHRNCQEHPYRGKHGRRPHPESI